MTIAIPTLDRPELCLEAVESAIRQTEQSIEILVSDNASSLDISSLRAGVSDKRVRFFEQPVRLEMAGHWNFLLARARAPLFLLLSDDDQLASDFVHEALETLRQWPSASVIRGRVVVREGSGEYPYPGPEKRAERGFKTVVKALNQTDTLHLCSIVFPASALRSAGGFPESLQFACDSGAWMRLALNGQVVFSQNSTAYYRQHAGSTTNSSRALDQAADYRKLVSLVVEAAAGVCTPREIALLRSAGKILLARSSASLIARQAAFGADRLALVRTALSLASELSGDLPFTVPRLAAALTLPSSWLAGARRRVNGNSPAPSGHPAARTRSATGGNS
jgi:GT2 family glycosyltransferase